MYVTAMMQSSMIKYQRTIVNTRSHAVNKATLTKISDHNDYGLSKV